MQSKIQFDLRQYTECTCMYCNIFVTVSKKSTIMININHHHPRSYNALIKLSVTAIGKTPDEHE